jgi:hypothetical protein
VLVIALSQLFAGCDILTKLGIGSGDDSDEGGEPAWTGPQIVAEEADSIKAKFGIEAEGTEGVTAAFETLHAFIQSGGLARYPDAIRLGDWIDLEGGLAVEAYGEGGGDFLHDAAAATREITLGGKPWGTLCRLIVAGINSFQSGKGSDGKYEITDNDGTPHVVFQFQNVPVERRMNPTNDNTGGYAVSEMRKYLVPVENDGASGNFLAGLTVAGVPEEVLWAPVRYLSAGTDGTGSVAVSDKLWLPTERELFQDGKDTTTNRGFSVDGETAANQARLAYYTDASIRRKVSASNSNYPVVSNFENSDYWESSSADVWPNDPPSKFCDVTTMGTTGGSWASLAYGVAPAFCVN